ncbi:MAG TPA: Asd/ArgC dimerization domain-containing protein [Gaiellaceae bacterium]|nr:Asd/ArgC dimerization domain-containing protein [Gaiellaceae bacterium]
MNASDARVGVVGATGAVGTVTLRLLRERGYENVRAFASARSAGRELDKLIVEEATAQALAAGGLDLVLFSCGTSASRELVPHAVEGGALVVDKSSAYRLEEGYPLVVPEVNGDRAAEAIGTTRVVANPNCSSIPLTCVLEPLREAAGLRRVRVSTYQAVSGAGAQRMEQLRAEPSAEHDLGFDWTWEGDETEEESKIRAETRKILELPELPLSATTVRIPVLVGHSQSLWVETEQPLSPEQAESVLASAPGVRLVETPTSRAATETEDVLVGRIRPDRAAESNGLVLFLACDNLVKGAALNALQIAELLLDATSSASRAA